MTRVAFVLGGGGRWGATEVGMLRALAEHHIVPNVVLGTSIGAFNGSVVAGAPGLEGVARLERLWIEIGEEGIFQSSLVGRVKNVATLKPAIHSTEEIRGLLLHVHPSDALIESLAIPFQCVAASIENASEHWFTEGPLIEALLASAAVPGLFPPVRIGGEHFYDGGLVNSVPLTRALELGAQQVFVMQVGRVESALRAPERLHEAGLVAFEIARRHRFTTTMANIPLGVEVHVLPSGNPVSFDDTRQIRWRDISDTQQLIEGAYQHSMAYLDSL